MKCSTPGIPTSAGDSVHCVEREEGGGSSTHDVSSSTNGGEDFIPDTVANEFGVDFFFDFSHVEKGVFVGTDENDGTTIFCPDIRVQEPFCIEFG